MALPTLQYSLACDEIANTATNKLVFVGVVSEVKGLRYPLYVPQLYLVNGWYGGQGQFEERVEIRSSDGGVLVTLPAKLLTFSIERSSVVSFYRVALVFPSPGDYIVQTHLREKVVGEFPLPAIREKLTRQDVGEGSLIRGSGPEVYLIEGGKRRHIPDGPTFEALGLKWESVIDVPDDQLEEYPSGKPLSSVLAGRRGSQS